MAYNSRPTTAKLVKQALRIVERASLTCKICTCIILIFLLANESKI